MNKQGLKRQQEVSKNTSSKTALLLADDTVLHAAPGFARVMAAVMSDLVNESLSPKIANAVCNAGGKLLKVVEMQHRYGTAGGGVSKTLELVPSK